jgi:hypothetical protein
MWHFWDLSGRTQGNAHRGPRGYNGGGNPENGARNKGTVTKSMNWNGNSRQNVKNLRPTQDSAEVQRLKKELAKYKGPMVATMPPATTLLHYPPLVAPVAPQPTPVPQTFPVLAAMPTSLPDLATVLAQMSDRMARMESQMSRVGK